MLDQLDFSGKWVLVTGASSGLGREFARSLARDHKANLILVARRKPRLEDLKKELEQTCSIQVETIVADLSKLEGVDQAVTQALEGRQLHAAILNAGITYFGEHEQLDWDYFEAMLATNVTGVMRMTQALLAHFKQNPSGGGLMMVSSMAGIVPVAYQSAYSGTKAFLVAFGCALSHELVGSNNSITVYAPGGILTEMTHGKNFRSLSRWLMPAERVAAIGLKAFSRRKLIVVPGFVNQLGAVLAGVLPRRWLGVQVSATYRRALGIESK